MAEESKAKNDVKHYPVIRCVLIGASRTGKSTLVCRFINNYFEQIYTPTHSLREYRRIFDLMEGETSDSQQYCMLQIDDCFPIDHPDLAEEGEGEASQLGKVLEQIIDNAKPEKSKRGAFPYIGSQIYAYIYTYDPSNLASLEAVSSFMKYIKVHEDQQAGRKKAFISVKYLVALKADLFEHNPLESRLKQLSSQYDAKLLEISALENRNVNELFRGLSRAVLDSNIIQLEALGNIEDDEAAEGGFSFFGCCGSRDKGGESKSKCALL
jgi:GTPase SAR1 family protein